MKSLFLPESAIRLFVELSAENTVHNIETLGLLRGVPLVSVQ